MQLATGSMTWGLKYRSSSCHGRSEIFWLPVEYNVVVVRGTWSTNTAQKIQTSNALRKLRIGHQTSEISVLSNNCARPLTVGWTSGCRPESGCLHVPMHRTTPSFEPYFAFCTTGWEDTVSPHKSITLFENKPLTLNGVPLSQ